MSSAPHSAGPGPRVREIRAAHDADSLTVYQAYPAAIADAALAAGTFVPPFKRERMTWIKPSFRWMMYRCGWGRKPGQERVLAIRIRRDGFAWALANSCLSHPDGEVHASHEQWKRQLAESPVRVQWDPERDIRLQPLPHRAIQVGLTGEAVRRYVEDWILDLTDVTELAHEAHSLVRSGEAGAAEALLPAERPYPISAELAARIGASAG
ncbi:DUF4291 domain-containing protein [Phaeacidiphilus oryzae]|uniref:DUF4291 domain-containing protein n=1 Tax=Phaeacidiphilus oryzae TaxID=348818 RepID=UPI00056154E6|nr:DUF4291 domain-containing protein [Phaeacidiphilus oryzae]